MNLLNGAKAALYGIFLNYYCYYVLTGAFIPGGTVLFLAAAMFFVGLDVLQQRQVYVGTEVKCWVAYAVLAFLTTALVTLGSSGMDFVGDIVKYVQRLGIIMMVAYICEREGSIRFGLQLMAVTAIALAVSAISVIGDFRLKLDITSGANLSDNDTGSIMAYGCFAILFAWGRRDRISLLLSMLKAAGVICCIVVIFLAGSRKSIFGVLILGAGLLLLCLRDYGRRVNLRKLVTVAIVGAALYLFITENLLPYAEQTNLYTRLIGRGAEAAASSDDGRARLIQYALEDFLNNPVFGLGFNKFTEYHGNYTHCTYVESLACSGIVGLLYLYPYYIIVKKQIYLILHSQPGSYARLKQKELLVYLCVFLFVGIGIPYMYKDAPCIVLGTFIANQAISFRELREQGRISEYY